MQAAEDAAAYAKEGLLERARQRFVDLISNSDNLRILYLAYEFFRRIGDLDTAFAASQKWLALSGRDQQSASTAASLGNLGILYRTRGDLNRAEEMEGHWGHP